MRLLVSLCYCCILFCFVDYSPNKDKLDFRNRSFWIVFYWTSCAFSSHDNRNVTFYRSFMANVAFLFFWNFFETKGLRYIEKACFKKSRSVCDIYNSTDYCSNVFASKCDDEHWNRNYSLFLYICRLFIAFLCFRTIF